MNGRIDVIDELRRVNPVPREHRDDSTYPSAETLRASLRTTSTVVSPTSLRRRVAAIVEVTDPLGSVTEAGDPVPIDLKPSDARAPQRRRRSRRVAGGLLAVATAAAVVAALAVVTVRDDSNAPADSRSGLVTSITNGWVAFASYEAFASDNASTTDSDVYVVREGSPAQRIAGSDSELLFQVCPAFSPDGERLLFGQAEGHPDDGFHDTALVVAAMSADGRPSATTTIELDGTSLPPCAIWSADGRWAAFGVSTSLDPDRSDEVWDEVWVVDTVDGEVTRRLSGLTAVDFDWAPDRSALAIASDGEIWIYSVTSDEQYPVGPVSDVQSVAWSPDGAHIAITRPGSGSPNQQDLWVMRTDGSGAAVVASDSRGIAGPRWSPDGERIAYTRLCEVRATLQFPCREEQEVVLVSVDVHDPFRPSGTQAVVPHPETVDADGLSTWWYSVSVTWSPNGTTLLYIGWPEADPDDPPRVLLGGLVAVPLDGNTAPLVLHETQEFTAYGEATSRPPHSWGRQPVG